jgi:hypothetical protein
MAKRSSSSSRTLTDHHEIQRWAEQRGGKPTCVLGTGGNGDVGMIRIDFPGYSGEGSLEEISWDDWFDKFDERNLALLVQDETAAAEQSNFNKLVTRGAAERGRRGQRSSRSRAASSSGRSRSARVTGRSRGSGTAARSSRNSTRSSRSERASSSPRKNSRTVSKARSKKANSSVRRSSKKKAA